MGEGLPALIMSTQAYGVGSSSYGDFVVVMVIPDLGRGLITLGAVEGRGGLGLLGSSYCDEGREGLVLRGAVEGRGGGILTLVGGGTLLGSGKGGGSGVGGAGYSGGPELDDELSSPLIPFTLTVSLVGVLGKS